MDRNLKSDDFKREVLEFIKEKKPKSVEDLKIMLNDVIALPEEEILKIILNLREKGIIKLDYTKARSSDRRTPTSTWLILTIAIGIITLLTVFAIPENLFPWIYIRNFFGLAFVLFLPGHSFIKAFFPLNLPKTEGQKECCKHNLWF